MYGSDDTGLGTSTYVSEPGNQSSATPGMTSPGSQGLGKSMAVHHAVIWLIGGSAVALVAIGVVFRRPIGKA